MVKACFIVERYFLKLSFVGVTQFNVSRLLIFGVWDVYPMESGFKVLFCLLKFQTSWGKRSDVVDPKYVCMFYALCDYVSFNSFGC
jgi:hypothetical protein